MNRLWNGISSGEEKEGKDRQGENNKRESNGGGRKWSTRFFKSWIVYNTIKWNDTTHKTKLWTVWTCKVQTCFWSMGFVAEFVKLIVWFQYSRVKNEDEITWSKNANPWKTRTMYGWRRKTKRITGWKWPKLNLTVHYHFVFFMPFKLFTRFWSCFCIGWNIFFYSIFRYQFFYKETIKPSHKRYHKFLFID